MHHRHADFCIGIPFAEFITHSVQRIIESSGFHKGLIHAVIIDKDDRL